MAEYGRRIWKPADRSYFTVLTARIGKAGLLPGTDGTLLTDDRKKAGASSRAGTFYSIHPAS